MKTDLYQIMDTVAGHVDGPIFTAPNDAAAIRMIRNTIKDPKTSLRDNLRDYNLLCIGAQNEETGQLETNEIRTVITGSQLLATLDLDKQ